MKNSLFDEVSNIGLTIRLEIPAKDLDRQIEKAIVKTSEIVLAKFENERSPEFIPRKETMKMLNVKTANTMSSWEEKGYLKPHRLGRRIYYRQDELADAVQRFRREEDV